MKQKIVAVNGLAGSGKDESAKILVDKYYFVAIALADPLKRFLMDVYHFSEEQLWGPSYLRNQPDERYCMYSSDQHTLITRGSTTHVWCTRCQQEFPTTLGSTPSLREINQAVEGPCKVYLTPRKALQQLGDEWGRGLYKDTWVEYLLRTARTLGLGQSVYRRTRGLVSLRDELSLAAPRVDVVVPDVRYVNEFQRLRNEGALTIRVKRPGAGLSGAFGMHPSEREQLEIPDSAFHHIILNDGTLDDLHAEVEKVVSGFDFG